MILTQCIITTLTAHEASENSGDSPVPNDPSVPDAAFLPDQSLRREKYREEEERLLRKDAERKRRKKQKKETEKWRKQLEQQEQEEKMRKLREEAEKRAAEEEEKRKRMEEFQRVEEERMRRREKEQREMLRTLEEAAARAQNELRAEEAQEEEEEEETVWLRGDVFQMPPQLPTPPDFPSPTEPSEPSHDGGGVDTNEESARISYALPQGCTVSDVIVSCENAKLTSIPPLSIPELKSLNLQGKNDYTSVQISLTVRKGYITPLEIIQETIRRCDVALRTLELLLLLLS